MTLILSTTLIVSPATAKAEHCVTRSEYQSIDRPVGEGKQFTKKQVQKAWGAKGTKDYKTSVPITVSSSKDKTFIYHLCGYKVANAYAFISYFRGNKNIHVIGLVYDEGILKDWE